MQNTRFPVYQVRVQGERIAAEHDMALGPILRNSGVPGNRRFLSGHARYESEKHHTPYRSGNIRMRWFHEFLRWQWIAPIVAAFRSMGTLDFAGGQSRRNRQGFCRLDDVYRGTAGDEYGDDGIGSRALRLQLEVAALSVCSHRANGRLSPGGWRSSCAGRRDYYRPWDDAAGGPFGYGNDYPGVMILVLSVLPQSSSCHHPRVIQVRCNSTFLPAINSDKTHDLVIQWPTKVTRGGI